MKTIFALLGLFMFASVSSTDVTTTTSTKEIVKGYYLTADNGGNKNDAGTGIRTVKIVLI